MLSTKVLLLSVVLIEVDEVHLIEIETYSMSRSSSLRSSKLPFPRSRSPSSNSLSGRPHPFGLIVVCFLILLNIEIAVGGILEVALLQVTLRSTLPFHVDYSVCLEV